MQSRNISESLQNKNANALHKISFDGKEAWNGSVIHMTARDTRHVQMLCWVSLIKLTYAISKLHSQKISRAFVSEMSNLYPCHILSLACPYLQFALQLLHWAACSRLGQFAATICAIGRSVWDNNLACRPLCQSRCVTVNELRFLSWWRWTHVLVCSGMIEQMQL